MADKSNIPQGQQVEGCDTPESVMSRRKFGQVIAGAIAGTCVLSTNLLAQGVDAPIQLAGFTESKLDYSTIAESPVDDLLEKGYPEFVKNATPVFGEETSSAWQDMAREIGTGAVAKYTVEAMKEFTPNMLSSFSKIPVESIKYKYLGALGLEFNSERLGKTT